MRLRSKTSILLMATLALLTLVGCAPQAPEANDGTLTVVASTNVYGDIAKHVGGELITVTSIINDPSQDPHSYEADARDQLALSKADIVLENGGGYDPFVDQLLANLDVPHQVVINAVKLSPIAHADESASEPAEAHDHAMFNEHVWYDFPTVKAVITQLRDTLARLDPHNAARYESNAAALLGDLDALREREVRIRAAHENTGVAVTESVPLYLLTASGLRNVTPSAFSTAIEDGSEVSPAVLNVTLKLFSTGEAKLLVYNDQTTSPETEALLAAAKNAAVPIVAVTEILPKGTDYVGWMNGILDSIDSALGKK